MLDRRLWMLLAMIVLSADVGASLLKNVLNGSFMFSNNVSYNVEVFDDKGYPVPSVTLWVILRTAGAENLYDAFLQEQVSRFSKESDYIESFRFHNKIEVAYTDEAGKVSLSYEKNSLGDFSEIVLDVAVIKRGYRAEVLRSVSKRGSSNRIKVILHEDTEDVFDKRLLQTDILRSRARHYYISDLDAESKASYLNDISLDMENLALAMEKYAPNDAAKAYFILASMPTVDVFYNKDNSVGGISFNRGLTLQNDRSRGFYEKSLLLNDQSLNMRIKKLRYHANKDKMFDIQVGEFMPDPSNKELRDAYLNNVEEIIAEDPSSVWPRNYWGLFREYEKLSRYEDGCRVLGFIRKFYPDYLNENKVSVSVRRMVSIPKLRGLPGYVCKVGMNN